MGSELDFERVEVHTQVYLVTYNGWTPCGEDVHDRLCKVDVQALVPMKENRRGDRGATIL